MWLSPCMSVIGIFLIVRKVQCQQEYQKPRCFPYTVTRKLVSIIEIELDVESFKNVGLARNFFKPVSGKPFVPKLRFRCGMRMSTASIVSGYEAFPNSWPWQALLSSADGRAIVLCGGTLISNQWVVTAAHCAPGDKERISVALGVHDPAKMGKYVTKIDATLDDFYVHPGYDKNVHIDKTSDIALIKFRKPVEFNRYIRPACLPKTGEHLPKRCVSIGWGTSNVLDKPDVYEKLKEIKVRVDYNCSLYPNYYCAWSLEKVPSGNCYGDSGGPLLCQRDGVFYVAGIVSHSASPWTDCDQRVGHDALFYTNVTNFLQWINQTVMKKG